MAELTTWDGMLPRDAIVAREGDGTWVLASEARREIAALEAEVARLRGLVEATCNEFAEEIKHTSHMDGLGMGDQRSESVVLALKYRLRKALEEEK